MINLDEKVMRLWQDSAKWDEEVCKNNLVPLSIADMDFKCAKPIQKALHQMIDNEIYGYTYRSDTYYESIIRWLKVRHNIEIKKENIIPSFGVVPSIHAAIKAFSSEGDYVLINTPCYDPFFSSIESHNRKIIESPLRFNQKSNQYEINFDEVEECLKKAKIYLLCSPHNPTGRVWNDEELDHLSLLCKKYNVTVIADEIHNDLILSDKKHISFLNFSRKYGLKAIVLGSPSKTFNLAGLNISYCITENEEAKQNLEKQIFKTGFYHNNMAGLAALKAAYTECDTWLDEVLEYLKKNRDFVYEKLMKYKDNIQVIKPEGTYLMLIKFYDYSSGQIVDIFKRDLKLVVNNGDSYKCESGYIRLNFACSREQLKIAVSKIEEFILKTKL